MFRNASPLRLISALTLLLAVSAVSSCTRSSITPESKIGVFAYNELNAQTAAILYDVARPCNKGIAERFIARFNQLGGVVQVSRTYVTGKEDFSEELELIAALEPDLLLLPNHNNDVPLPGPQAGVVRPDAIRDALYALGPFEGLSGTIDYKDSGDPVKNVAALSFDEGKVVFNKMVTT